MAKIETVLTKMEYIKREVECCCCFSKDDLFSMLEPYNYEENVEIYSTMIAECFRIDLSSHIEECKRSLYSICKNCVLRLRDAVMLRSQVQLAYDRLQGLVEDCKNSHVAWTTKNTLNKYTSDLAEHYCKVKKDQCDPLECSHVVETTENVLKCDISVFDKMQCNSEASISDKLDFTNRSKANVENFVYNICSTDFGQEDSLKDHIIAHFKCERCKVGFASKAAFETHLKLNHESIGDKKRSQKRIRIHSESKDFTCNICGKSLSNKYTLENHVLMHSGVKNQKCDMCEKAFATKLALQKHRRLHLNPKKWKCKYCNKAFQYNFTLLQHEKIHLNVKDLICDYCQRKFRCKSNLERHIMLHTGTKNIKCDLCEKYLVSKASLWSHKRARHSVSLPCEVCGLLCKSKLLLAKHMLVHTHGERFICDNCGGTYRTKNNVRRHIMKYCKGKN